jgi:hypothetical protein
MLFEIIKMSWHASTLWGDSVKKLKKKISHFNIFSLNHKVMKKCLVFFHTKFPDITTFVSVMDCYFRGFGFEYRVKYGFSVEV